jgi:CBS-domain-containing membrane protein
MITQIASRIVDPKLKGSFKRYVFQSGLAAIALFLVLAVEDAFSSSVVIVAAIGSTTFILFVTPHVSMAMPRRVIGGHIVCLTIGSVVAIFADTEAGRSILDSAPIVFELQAALAVGVGIFLMAATDTEHGPAAGTALGTVVLSFSWSLVLFVVTSVTLLSMFQTLIRSRLRNLL